MPIDAKFFIIVMGFIATIIPLISEIIILPIIVKKCEIKDATRFNQIFKNITNLAFFYFLFISFLIALWDYFNPIIIEHPIWDLSFFLCLVLVYFFGIYSYDYKRKGLIFEQSHAIISAILIFILFGVYLMSLGASENSGAIIDKPFVYIISISIIIQVVIFDKLRRNIF